MHRRSYSPGYAGDHSHILYAGSFEEREVKALSTEYTLVVAPVGLQHIYPELDAAELRRAEILQWKRDEKRRIVPAQAGRSARLTDP